MHDRLFRALLRLLPAEFRGAYGSEMEATFREERREARGFSLLSLWAGTLADLARTAPSEHWDVFVRDARFAFRSMATRKTLTVAAVVTLGLGIGANVAMFAVADAVLLTPLDYRDPDRLVIVQEQGAGREPGNLGYLTFLDLQSRTGAFSGLAAASQSQVILGGDGRDAERVGAMRASASYFDVIGVSPVLGRAFRASEDKPGEARRVVILSDGLWRRRFGADPSVIGRPVSLSGTAFTVVGVMPKGFDDLVAARLYEGAELWTPLGYDPAAEFACRTCRHLRVFGRVAPGIGLEQAQRDATAVLEGVAREHPTSYDAPVARVRTLGDFFLGPVRPVLLALWAGVALLLLAACANVANLLLLRASERGHEMAVRVALGVTRGRLVRQLLTESALLAALGGLAGLLPAWAALRLVAVSGPAQLPRLADAAFDGRAVLAAVGLAAVCSLIFGLVPLRQLTRDDVTRRMHGAGRRTDGKGTWRLRAALVSSNMALAVLLLVGAGLLVRSLTGLLAVPAGFDPKGVLTLRVDLHGPRYDADDRAEEIARVTAFYETVLARVRGVPGVSSASAINTLPLGGGVDSSGLHLVDRPLANPEEAPDADRFAVMPGFFETLRIGLLRGRFLDERDAQGAPRVVVVNRTLAEDLFADQDALGREVRLGPPTAQPRTIVGVVADTRHRGLHVPPVYQVYVPAPQWGGAESMMTLTVRTTGDPRQLAPAVREVARALDPAQPVTNVRAYEDVVAGSLGTERFAATLLAGFAAAALLLALVGLYGALGVVVRQREREIGVRMALGAAAAQVRAMVLRQGLGPVGAGLAAGLVLAAACARLLGSLLHGVSTWDPRTFAGAAALLAVSAVGAALLPAWRASRTDPAITLRSE